MNQRTSSFGPEDPGLVRGIDIDFEAVERIISKAGSLVDGATPKALRDELDAVFIRFYRERFSKQQPASFQIEDQLKKIETQAQNLIQALRLETSNDPPFAAVHHFPPALSAPLGAQALSPSFTWLSDEEFDWKKWQKKNRSADLGQAKIAQVARDLVRLKTWAARAADRERQLIERRKKVTAQSRHEGDKALDHVYLSLEGIWTKFFGELPAVTLQEGTEKEGVFIGFVLAVLEEARHGLRDSFRAVEDKIENRLKPSRKAIKDRLWKLSEQRPQQSKGRP